MRLASARESRYEFWLEPFKQGILSPVFSRRYFHSGIFTSASSARNLLSRTFSGF